MRWRVARNEKIDVGRGPRTLKRLSLMGYCDPQAHILHVRSDLAPVETEKTFVHELLHAACAARIPDDFEEVAVESMETGVLDVIRQFAGLDAFPADDDG